MTTPTNAINVSQNGLVKFDATNNFTAVTVTANNVLVGATSNGIASVPPGVAGTVLQSTGVSSNPNFSTATYPATTTINQVLYSSAANTVTGITAANNGTMISSSGGVPSWLANGTTSQVLTATTGSPPSWQAVPSSFAPNTTVQMAEDFIGAGLNSSAFLNSNFTWLTSPASAVANSGALDSAHPGLVFFGAIANNQAGGIYSFEATRMPFLLGGGAITFNWVFKITTLSNATNRYVLRIGFGDTISTAAGDQTNGAYVEYSDNINSGNWVYKTASAGTRTTSNSTTAATAAWHNLQVTINAAASSISYVMDGVSLGTAITTNIPTTIIGPFAKIDAGSVAGFLTNNVYLDLFYLTQTLTSTR